MMAAGSLAWFARHELRLAWRDVGDMLTRGRRRRIRGLAIAALVFTVIMHLVASVILGGAAMTPIDGHGLTTITVLALLSASAMLSQAIESVTRAFYVRADLDLILTSPASTARLFAVRLVAIALSLTLMTALVTAPFIDVLALESGAPWLAAYGLVAALGMTATALAGMITLALFRLIGPRRTRLIAQIVAAVIGAGFIVGLQLAAVLSQGSLSRFSILGSSWLLRHLPPPESLWWWPARAATGELVPFVASLAVSALLLLAAVLTVAPRFGEHVFAAAETASLSPLRRTAQRLRASSPAQALRRKEWALLRRDPWLLSQTLMQVLYLLPPAFLLSRSFAGPAAAAGLLVPVLVMAAGQLAGGLAWLSISGEDAPDLVGTAPVSAAALLRAKVEAVIGGLSLVFVPMLAALALASPRAALVTGGGIAAAAASATAIQLWFRGQAKRSHFRRRLTSSRVATYAEAFCSIAWAGTGALLAAGTMLAVFPGLLAAGILLGARFLSPAREA